MISRGKNKHIIHDLKSAKKPESRSAPTYKQDLRRFESIAKPVKGETTEGCVTFHTRVFFEKGIL
jgi:hypothetical protein